MFWLHHTNIDRPWATWQARTVATMAADQSLTEAWKNKAFSFKMNSSGAMFQDTEGDTISNRGFASETATCDCMLAPSGTPATILPAAGQSSRGRVLHELLGHGQHGSVTGLERVER